MTVYMIYRIEYLLDLVDALCELVPFWSCPMCGAVYDGRKLTKEVHSESLVKVTINHEDPTHSPCQFWYDHGECYPA